MGNICRACLGRLDRRRVLRKYTSLDTGRNRNDEGADLFMDDEDGLLGSSSSNNQSVPPISEQEKLLLKSRNYAAIIHSQKTFDEQIDKQLAEQEEKLRREEEELMKSRRDRIQQLKEQSRKPQSNTNPQSSSTQSNSNFPTQDDTEWNVAGGNDDFDMFLESISKRERPHPAGEDEEEEINEDDFVSAVTPSS